VSWVDAKAAVAEREAASVDPAGVHADPGDVLYASPGPGARGATPLGLPYPEPTDLLADAAAHVKALSDAVSVLLAAPGQVWAPYVTTQNVYGGIWCAYGSLTGVLTYLMQSGYRGATTPAQGYVFLFVLGGTWNTTSITCNCYT